MPESEPDFATSCISGISHTIDKFLWEYPTTIPDGPEHGDGWHHVEYELLVAVEGTPIPEPGTVLLLGLGAVMVRRKR